MSSPEIEVFITRGNTLAAWVGGELNAIELRIAPRDDAGPVRFFASAIGVAP